MIKLQALGQLEILGADGRVLHAVLAQPKRQALLVYLAVAVPRGYHRRDTLVALLWPDRDEEHARGSLSTAVSRLRQALGADALLSRGHAELGLDWHLVWCDAAGFEEALDQGAQEEAMALYRGELLPGFHLDEVPEFDHWLERERARLRARAIQAARLLSEREEAGGQLAAAIEWGRRAAALDPFDESSVRRVMTLLDNSADRAGALRTYGEFAATLHDELEACPAGETTALMETIRDRRADATPRPVPAPAASPLPPPARLLAPLPSPSARRARPPLRAWGMIATGVAVAVALIAGWALLARRRTNGATTRRATVAILPFSVEGTAATADVGYGLVSLLADRLNHDGPLRALDAAAVRRIAHVVQADNPGADSARRLVARLHPRFVLLGHVETRGDSLRVTAALFDSTTGQGPIARASASGAGDDMSRVSEDIVWQILATRPLGGARWMERAPADLTSSLVALRAFLAGVKELRAGQFAFAEKAFKAAVDADSTFALAYLNLDRAATWADDYPMADYAKERALRYIDRLAEPDQVRVRAMFAPDPRAAERLIQLILVNDDGLADAWYELGELRFHWGRLLGWTEPEARDAYEQALAIWVGDAGTQVHLARIAAAEGRVSELDSLVRRTLATGVDQPLALEMQALRAHARGDRAAIAGVQDGIARLDDNAALSVVTTASVFAAEFPSSSVLPRGLMLARRAPRYRATGAILAAELAVAHGRILEAERELDTSSALTPARALEYRAAIATLPFRPAAPAEAQALRAELLALHGQVLIGPGADQYAENAIYPPRRTYLLAMLSLEARDTVGAARYVRQLETTTADQVNDVYQQSAARLIRAELLRAAGQPARALDVLGAPSELPGGVLPDVLHYPSAHERFLRAELWAELGNPKEALRWYETFPDPAAYDLMYLPAVHVGAGAMYEQLRDTPDARASYQRAIDLLSGQDAGASPLLEQARARVAALR